MDSSRLGFATRGVPVRCLDRLHDMYAILTLVVGEGLRPFCAVTDGTGYLECFGALDD